MKPEEFITLIESIGFKNEYDFYYYKEFTLYFHAECYDFWNGSNWIKYIPYTDLTPDLLKLIRSHKLKALLGEPRLISKI